MIKILFLSAFLNSLAWIALTPIWQFPDEQAHFAQVQYITVYGPTIYNSRQFNTTKEIVISEKIFGTERTSLGDNKFTYHPEFKIPYDVGQNGFYEMYLRTMGREQKHEMIRNEATFNPPLYYSLAAVPNKLLEKYSIIERVMSIRIMSAIVFLILVYVSLEISKFLFFENKILVLTIPSVIAFTPMLVHASVGVLPDPLTNLLFSLMLLISLKILYLGVKFRYLQFGSILIALGLLTRQHFVISILIFGSTLLYKFIKSKTQFALAFGAVTIFIIFLSLITQHTRSIPFLAEIRIPERDVISLKYFSIKKLSEYISLSSNTYYNQIFPWYWGVYRWLSLSLPLAVYRIIKLITILSVIGLIFAVVKYKYKKGAILFLAGASLLYLLIFVLGDYFFFAKNGFSFGIQGRYFFPLIVAHIVLLVFGIWTLTKVLNPNQTKYIMFLLFALTVLYNDFSLFYLSKSYYSTSNLNVFLTQASQYKPFFFKSNYLTLVLLITFLLQFLCIILFYQKTKFLRS